MPIYKGFFVIEDVLGLYPGYTNGDRWNGRATPYFEHAVGLRIVEDWKVGKADPYYDGSVDQFCFRSEGGEEWECFQAVMQEVQGQSQKLYPIGTFCWIWDDA